MITRLLFCLIFTLHSFCMNTNINSDNVNFDTCKSDCKPYVFMGTKTSALQYFMCVKDCERYYLARLNRKRK